MLGGFTVDSLDLLEVLSLTWVNAPQLSVILMPFRVREKGKRCPFCSCERMVALELCGTAKESWCDEDFFARAWNSFPTRTPVVQRLLYSIGRPATHLLDTTSKKLQSINTEITDKTQSTSNLETSKTFLKSATSPDSRARHTWDPNISFSTDDSPGSINFNFNFNINKAARMPRVEQTFKCTVSGCDKAYTAKSSLNNHMRGEHRGESHQCQHCGKRTADRSDARRHEAGCKSRPESLKGNDAVWLCGWLGCRYVSVGRIDNVKRHMKGGCRHRQAGQQTPAPITSTRAEMESSGWASPAQPQSQEQTPGGDFTVSPPTGDEELMGIGMGAGMGEGVGTAAPSDLMNELLLDPELNALAEKVPFDQPSDIDLFDQPLDWDFFLYLPVDPAPEMETGTGTGTGTEMDTEMSTETEMEPEPEMTPHMVWQSEWQRHTMESMESMASLSGNGIRTVFSPVMYRGGIDPFYPMVYRV